MSDIEKIVSQIKQSTDYQINRRALREKVLTELHMTYNNGMFFVTRDLIGFLSTWPDDILYIEDIYENPVEVNRVEMLDQCRQRYQAVMNSWHQRHDELRRIRKI